MRTRKIKRRLNKSLKIYWININFDFYIFYHIPDLFWTEYFEFDNFWGILASTYIDICFLEKKLVPEMGLGYLFYRISQLLF